MEQTIPHNSWKKRSRDIFSKQVKMTTFNGSEARLGMMSCIWRHRQMIMFLFTYLCSKICLLLNTPAAVGTTLRCRRNSRRFEARIPENNFRIELFMVDKGFGGRQQQKITLASGLCIVCLSIYDLIIPLVSSNFTYKCVIDITYPNFQKYFSSVVEARIINQWR